MTYLKCSKDKAHLMKYKNSYLLQEVSVRYNDQLNNV
jgi:hypothetical protein